MTTDPKTPPSATPIAIWDWRYELGDLKAQALYRKAVAEQWQADSLDWDYVIDPEREVIDPTHNVMLEFEFLRPLGKSQRAHFVALNAAETLSQILHGEQGALMTSCRLAQSMPDRDAKLFAAAQAMDEARHLDVFTRYIRRLHDIYPPAPRLSRVLEKVVSARHWQAQLVGMQIMIEGMALATFSNIRCATNCDLLRDLLRLVMRDEARHVAFGSHYLKTELDKMHPDDRAEVEIFAADLVKEFRQWGSQAEDFTNFFANLVEVGVDPLDYVAHLKNNLAAKGTLKLAPKMMRGLDSIIMPGLKRAGLITDRVRSLYLDDELDTAGDLHALQTLERSLVE